MIFAVRSDGTLLICDMQKLHIYNFDRYVLTIDVYNNETIRAVTWTPHDNIVYVNLRNEVVTTSKFGQIIKINTHIRLPQIFSTSQDNIIYLYSFGGKLHKSTDDGVTWLIIFGFNYKGIIQIMNLYTDNQKTLFWSLTFIQETSSLHLCEHTLSNDARDKNVTLSNINVTTQNGKQVLLSKTSSLTFDGEKNIFVSEETIVHIFSTNGAYLFELFSVDILRLSIIGLHVNSINNSLYVGYRHGDVQIFDLKYEDYDYL